MAHQSESVRHKLKQKTMAVQAGGEQSDWRFARILTVAQAEQDRKDDGSGPEAEGCAMAGFEGPLIKAGEAAGKRVLGIAPSEIFLQQTDQKKSEQPECSIAKNVAAKQEAAVDDEQAGLQQSQDDSVKTDDSACHTGEKVMKLAAVAKAVDRDGATLNL